MTGKENEVYFKLLKLGHVKVYRKHEIPAKYHYKNNKRIAPIIIVADEGYRICHNKSDEACMAERSKIIVFYVFIIRIFHCPRIVLFIVDKDSYYLPLVRKILMWLL